LRLFAVFLSRHKARRATAETAFLFVNSKVFDFFVERVAIDAKLNGGLGARTAASSQNLLNEFTFDAIDDFVVQVSIFVS
jgi:hypothetical protein